MPGGAEEVGQQRVAVLGGDAFGVELNAEDGPFTVRHAHDDALVGIGVYSKGFR